jgi:hypothetical protein
MQRFFFHLRKQESELTDHEGIVLTDASMAREMATRSMQDFLQQSSGRVDPERKTWSLSVCDARGRCVFSTDFAAAAALTAGRMIVAAARQPRRLAYVDVERRRRDHETVERRRRQLFERAAMLRDQTRYEVNVLYCPMQASKRARDRARELLARSRQQSQADQLEPELQPVTS